MGRLILLRISQDSVDIDHAVIEDSLGREVVRGEKLRAVHDLHAFIDQNLVDTLGLGVVN
jgi:hypothetical protein